MSRGWSDLFQENACDTLFTDEAHQCWPPRHSAVRSDMPHYTVVSIALMHISAVVRLSQIAGASIRAASGPSTTINDTAVDAIIFAVDDDGDVVAELDGVVMAF